MLKWGIPPDHKAASWRKGQTGFEASILPRIRSHVDAARASARAELDQVNAHRMDMAKVHAD
jgi:hypothetical protein